ncbi:YjcQ family protein [Acetonema longum]|uniref:Uncharacterized protein n=1 Tax=Acetonema longum DSM 6540 TaxID=1009370 RepID=F7NGE1_9FIRM|nr:YjcQ family protein [Acetonema longum]EGO64896.1 hypothetical protein ALO_05625 [Acetonema longum DSM 6540]
MREEAAKVLVAVYVELNSVAPQPGQISPASLQMEEESFQRAINILYTEGLISGASIKIGDDEANPTQVSIDDVLITRAGVSFMESYTGISHQLPKLDKLQKLRQKALDLGWAEIVGLINKTIADYGNIAVV